MGYRLSVSKLEEVYYGTKLYGYTNEEILESYRFLKNKGYIDGDEVWGYCCDNPIVMKVKDFKAFRELYAQDLKDIYNELISEDFLEQTEKIIELEDYEIIVLTWV